MRNAASGATDRRTSAASAYVLEGYEALDVIGSGTFGLIRKVRRKSDGALFARKELNFERMNERDRKHIVSEVNILRTLHHENVVRYEERYVDTENGILYIVMELCEGGDLGAIIKRCRRTRTHLPEDTVWTYFAQMTAALEACHYRAPPNTAVGTTRGTAHAILHRDLKPENVFLDVDQNVKLGDFGLSKQIAAQTFANTYVGTPYYMSPELASGQQYDIKSDIWALGCIVYELCALSPPFDAANQAELTRKIKQGVVPSLPRAYSRDLQETVNAMLQIDHRRRPTTRQLLQVRQIKWACRMHELGQLHRKVQRDREQVEARATAIEAREQAVRAREAELEHAGSVARAEERLRALETQQAEVQRREEACAAMQAEFTQRYEQWYHGERLQLQNVLAQKDADIAALQAQLAQRDQMTRRLSDGPAMPGRLPLRLTPCTARRVSKGHTAGDMASAPDANGQASVDTPPSDEWEDQASDEGEAAERVAAPPVLPALARLRQVETKVADVSDCSMKDASTIWRAQSMPEAECTASPMPNRVLAGLDTPTKPACAASAPASGDRLLAQDPQWHLVSEDERPSPFLKRVTRVPLDALARPTDDEVPGDAPQLVPGPEKGRQTVVPTAGREQENVPVAQRQRISFAEQRRRRSSLLRPEGARTALTRPDVVRAPIPRAPMPASPAGRVDKSSFVTEDEEGNPVNMHPDALHGPGEDFEGDTNPETGEIGGPKKDPLRWKSEWAFGGLLSYACVVTP
ncbi:hypothetical protein MBRA1_002155 [Malassezia brasiliensis]|uniref:non-specific serine/threonine protein kinase n=2 Tax=Malassezia TaxID=55193 RepID=A0AAF0INZ7_9BASI|nr:hypothetical protein MBRA1_002155 [Malassezia brasiliensis]